LPTLHSLYFVVALGDSDLLDFYDPIAVLRWVVCGGDFTEFPADVRRANGDAAAP
jgi:hypothetical protein